MHIRKTLTMLVTLVLVFGTATAQAAKKIVHDQVPRSIKRIAGRTLSTLTTAHAIGDLHRIYADARTRDIGFRYVDIPPTYVSQKKGMFDTSEMQRLHAFGEKLGASKNPWRKTPPHFEEVSGY